MAAKETILLRPLDFQPVTYEGQHMWLLRDPLQLSDRQLFMPDGMASILTLLDGTRNREEVHRALCALAGTSLPQEISNNALDQLDEACLLENERSARARQERLAAYRAQPYRPPELAGHGYPAEQDQLTDYLASFGGAEPSSNWQGRGIVSPHIDYARGGPVYAKVWHAAEEAILAADLVVILGTDHYGGLGTVTLTSRAYATPYGILPADETAVATLASALGEASAFADELHHRHEHSVELSAVWLHYLFHKNNRKPCPVVPVLIGSFQHFLANGHHPAAEERFNRFQKALAALGEGQRVVIVASVDLAHVGPAFGDHFVMDQARREALAAEDHRLTDAALQGDADGWYSRIAAVDDANRICGFSPTYFLLRHLGPTTGRRIAYDQCAADQQDASLVSICGLLLD